MSVIKKWYFAVFCFGIISLFCMPIHAAGKQGHKSGKSSESVSVTTQEVTPMPAPGKKVPIGKAWYFIYSFDKKPQMGTVIMKVEVYSMDGKKDTSLEIKGDAGMPSMRGAHESGERPFKLSRKGDYLLPIDIVMPGGWEIKITVFKAGKVIFRGSHQFNV